MSTLVTPSAKSHERVSGRWLHDISIANRKDWLAYYTKVAVGSPVPWLMFAFVALAFVSRAGVEIASWSIAILTLVYIATDRLSKPKEFRFFRAGADLFLLGYLLTTVATACMASSLPEALATIGGARWVALLFLFAYAWELFPGLNRVFYTLLGAAGVAALYGLWQHFTGMDVIRGAALPAAPVGEQAFFLPSGFFETPEVFGTLLAMALPFPAAAFLLSEDRPSQSERWGALVFALTLGLAVFWTYHPGLWLAAGAAALVTVVMKGRRILMFAGVTAAFFALVIAISYNSTDRLFTEVQKANDARADRQRAQINTQVKLWQENPVIGVGHKAEDAVGYDPGTGNVYFQVLAQAGLVGTIFYFLFILAFMLATYRIFQEIPPTHHWHRVLISGSLGSQVAFHVAGLYWSTIAEAHAMNLFVFILGSVSYLSEHYGRGLVPDDFAL